MSPLARGRHFGAAILAVVAGTTACSRDLPTRPTLILGNPPADLASAPLAENTLAARVSFTVDFSDSVRVIYRANDGAMAATPFRAVGGGPDTITVLGLHPATTYTYWVESRSFGISRMSDSSTFVTASLPADLGDVRLTTVSGTQSRYAATGVVTADHGYAVIFDTTGTIVWYHELAGPKVGVNNVVMQPNGNITAFVGNTSGWQPVDGKFVEMTLDGHELHTFRAPAGSYADEHELLLTGSGAATKAHFFTYTLRTMNLTGLGMGSAVSTAGHQIVRMDVSGNVEFTWDAWDHITFDEWVGDAAAKPTRGGSTDYDHPNAMIIDAAGNYVVSWRNLDQITSIDSQTGDLLWRIGGAKGTYTFVGDPQNGFTKQHAVKILDNGNMLVFDNGTDHSPAESRAVEYKLDHAAKTATMVWEYKHNPALFAQYVGWVDRLSDKRTWVAFSFFSRTVEVDAAGVVSWEGQLTINGGTPVSYRIVPIKSLYGYAGL